MKKRTARSGGLCSRGAEFSPSGLGGKPCPASPCTWRSSWRTHAPSTASSWSCMWFFGTTGVSTGSLLSFSASSLLNIFCTWWTPVTTPQWRCCGSGTGCPRDSIAQRSTRLHWRLTCSGMSTRTSRRTWRTSCPPSSRACAPTGAVQLASKTSPKQPSTSGECCSIFGVWRSTNPKILLIFLHQPSSRAPTQRSDSVSCGWVLQP